MVIPDGEMIVVEPDATVMPSGDIVIMLDAESIIFSIPVEPITTAAPDPESVPTALIGASEPIVIPGGGL
jgi:hypothetical protein